MPGVYESEEAARMAFGLSDEVLLKLQQSVNPDGMISLDNIKQLTL